MDTTSSRQTFWLIVGGGLLVGAALSLILFFVLPRLTSERRGPPVNPDTLEVAPVVGARAPDFALQRIDGQSLSLKDYRGSPVLINFWATWCGPCRIEMPFIQQRYESFGGEDGLKVLAVDFDEPQPDVAAFAESFSLTFDVLLDPGGEVQALYRIRGYPSSFFVDRDGVIQVQHIGVMTEGQLDEYLEKIGLP